MLIDEDNPVLNTEIWKPIQDIPSYEISSFGRVRNKKGKVFKTYIQNSGYENIKIHSKDIDKRHRQIHRLVAEAFLPNPDGKKYVNHKDGNKLNNTVENLEWCTCSENILHARVTGLNPYNKPTTGLKLKQRSKENIPTTNFLGVCWDKARNLWRAYVVWNNRKYMQKRFKTDYEAAQARDECVKQNNLPLPLNFC